MKSSAIAAIAAASFVLSASAALGAAAPQASYSPQFYQAAAAYCTNTGGQVETRVAVYGSNGPTRLYLDGLRQFCQYTRPDGSRIHLLTTTLYSQKPTLAALAYYALVPLGSCGGNPASCYCTLLGGSDQFGGTSGAGGGWFLKGAIDETLEACIFPDMSSIDSWGLTYHSQGIIRGANLVKLMRYKYPG